MKSQLILVLLITVLLLGNVSAGIYSGGTGEPNDPYLIATPNDLNSIGADPCDWDKHFKMIADINLADYTGTQFNIIGPNSTTPFTGVFDGNGLMVSNFTYESTDTDCIGLFGCVDGNSTGKGIIRNLGLIDPNVDAGSGDIVGCVVGYLNYDGTISNSHVSHCDVSGDNKVGGLVGQNQGGTLTGCSVTGDISGVSYVGGLVGENRAWVTDCYANCTVLGTGNYIGGLAGLSCFFIVEFELCSNCYAKGNDLIIWNCYAEGTIEGNDFVGGLVGRHICGIISNCYATSGVSGNTIVGGLVGTDGAIPPPFPCSVYFSVFRDCYAAGAVDGNSDVGGLVGSHDWGSYSDCFWDVNSTGQTTSAGGTGKTTAEMQTESTFTSAGWDFIEIWDIGENQTYPYLRVYPAGDLNHNDQVNLLDLAILAEHWLEQR